MTKALAFLLIALDVAAGASLDARQYIVHNPRAVPVRELHMVLSSHFDAGCKTPACGALADGEPDLCAKVGAGNAHGAVDPFGTGEPFNYHILNRYFDEFFPRAIARANASRGTDTPYTYMTQSWVAALYLDCENAGIVSWPGSGWKRNGMPVLHCPNASAVEEFKAALRRGDIFMHAFPHDGEASYYPDASLFEAALNVAAGLSRDLGIPPPTSVSQRDVPGWTRAALPVLKRYGINGLSFGAGTPPGKPDVPPVCVWRDEATQSDVVLTYETAYGDIHTVFVLPNSVALVAAWKGDNTGPAPVEDVAGFYEFLRKEFPGANVTASTFDRFFAIANSPEVKSQLPVVTEEIGDGWLYGVPSDPLKNSQFREVARQRLRCIERGDCDPSSQAMKAADRLLVKVPEHTWGVAQSWFLPDYENYTNAQFDRARAQQPLGFIKNNTNHADYNTTVNSWIEQRTYVTAYPSFLEESNPAFAHELSSALIGLETVVAPSTADLNMVSDPVGKRFVCGDFAVSFNEHGGVSTLDGTNSGTEWVNASSPVGQFFYESYTNNDFNVFLQDFASRLQDKGTWPNHSAIPDHGGCHYHNGSVDDMECGNFRKPNVSAAEPKRRVLSPTLTELWHGKLGAGGCRFVVAGSLSEESSKLAGAPRRVVTELRIHGSVLDFDVVQLQKRPTRLPEATFVTFNPAVDQDGWQLRVLNNTLDADDTLGRKGVSPTGEDWVFGGSPHLRGVEAVAWTGAQGSLTLTSLDVPIACMGERSPFPTPRTAKPDMSQGMHWNIFNNIWNTNYILWYPFQASDENIRSRFRMEIKEGLLSAEVAI